ncbi:hypothetical protein BD770DRAFT_432718, partial [Pilaira anomala]
MPPTTRQRANRGENLENNFPVRSRTTRPPNEPSAYRGRGYRNRHLPAGDRNQEYLQEGIPVVAREYLREIGAFNETRICEKEGRGKEMAIFERADAGGQLYFHCYNRAVHEYYKRTCTIGSYFYRRKVAFHIQLSVIKDYFRLANQSSILAYRQVSQGALTSITRDCALLMSFDYTRSFFINNAGMERCLREVSFDGTIIERHDDLYDEGIITRGLDGNPREIQEQYEARATARRERDLRRYRARANARQYASRTDYERSMRGRDYERGLNTGESSSSEEEETMLVVAQVLQSLVSQVDLVVDLKVVEEDLRLVVLSSNCISAELEIAFEIVWKNRQQYHGDTEQQQSYKQGDKVLLYNNQLSTKTKPRKLKLDWNGPFIIKNKLSETRVDLESSQLGISAYTFDDSNRAFASVRVGLRRIRPIFRQEDDGSVRRTAARMVEEDVGTSNEPLKLKFILYKYVFENWEDETKNN